MSSQTKHFLDTSVMRTMITGTSEYKEYFSKYFGDAKLYISPYVLMEFRRSLIVNWLEFYEVLEQSNIHSMSDAIAYWSHKFSASQLKAVLQLQALLEDRDTASGSRADKTTDKIALLQLIRRVELFIRAKFTDTGQDSTHCERSKILLDLSSKSSQDLSKAVKTFLTQFKDSEECRSKCKVDSFFLDRHQATVELYSAEAHKANKPKDTTKEGFIKLTQKLEKAVAKGRKGFTCYQCGSIGDAVIALDVPREMTLEHIDSSFNYLCPPIQQPHHKHLSELAFFDDLDDSDEELE